MIHFIGEYFCNGSFWRASGLRGEEEGLREEEEGGKAGKALRRSPSHLWSSDWQTQRHISLRLSCLIVFLFFCSHVTFLSLHFLFPPFRHRPAEAVVPPPTPMALNPSFISVDRCRRFQFMYLLVSPLWPQHSVFLSSRLLCYTALVRRQNSKKVLVFFLLQQ